MLSYNNISYYEYNKFLEYYNFLLNYNYCPLDEYNKEYFIENYNFITLCDKPVLNLKTPQKELKHVKHFIRNLKNVNDDLEEICNLLRSY